MTFRVGMKVVCVDAKGATLLRERAVYNVLAIDHPFIDVDCPVSDGGCRGYFATRFRPIVENKTDISIFTQMLAPSRRKETV